MMLNAVHKATSYITATTPPFRKRGARGDLMQPIENPFLRKGDFDDPIFWIDSKLRILFKEKKAVLDKSENHYKFMHLSVHGVRFTASH